MLIRLLSLVIASAVLIGCTPPANEGEEDVPEDYAVQPLTAEHLANLIAADGARHTVLVLTGPADPTGIDKVFAGVATGQADWLAVVPAIEPELETPQAGALQNALATALLQNPSGVLALIPDHADPQVVCRRGDAPAVRAALSAVTDPGLQAARTECLRVAETG